MSVKKLSHDNSQETSGNHPKLFSNEQLLGVSHLSDNVSSVSGNSPGGEIFAYIFFILARAIILSELQNLSLTFINTLVIKFNHVILSNFSVIQLVLCAIALTSCFRGELFI
jgi:hypothetical protein